MEKKTLLIKKAKVLNRIVEGILQGLWYNQIMKSTVCILQHITKRIR